jgi:hypothetical protein
MRPIGLQLEEARTNLLVRSEEFGTTWSPSNITVSPDAIVAPNGTLTADKAIATTTNGAHQLFQVTSGTSGVTYTISFYVKAGEYNRFNFGPGNTAVGGDRLVTINLGLSNPVVSQDAIFNSSAFATPVGNGWYRVGASFTATATGTMTVAVLQTIINNAGSSSFAGDGTSGIYLWGAQLEAGAFLTSYIPTTSATVTRAADVSTSATATRAADVASITGSAFSSWYRQDEGTLFAETQLQSIAARSAAGFDINDNSTNNRIVFRALTTSVADQIVIRSGSSTVFSAAGVSPAPTTASRKSAVGYKVNDFMFTAIGTAGFTGTTGAVPLSVNQMLIGYEQGPTGYMGGTIKRLTYWPQALPSRLQSITQ